MAQEKKEQKEKTGSAKKVHSSKAKLAKSRQLKKKQTSKKTSRKTARKMPRKVGTKDRGNILARANLSPVQLSIIILGLILALILIASFLYMYNIARKSSRALAENSVITQGADKSWMTRVVNSTNPINTDLEVLTSIADPETGAQVDDRATKEAQELLKAVQGAAPDEKVNILAAYTSAATYQDAYNKSVARLMEEQGISKQEAAAQVQASSGSPGTNEHSTGLLVNFGVNGTVDSETVKNSEAGNWLLTNAWRYGFIQRYPEGKEASTGHAADPTAYRYVGEENAQRIYTQNLSLEEYVALLAQEKQEEEQRKAEEAAAAQQAQEQAQQQQ